MLTMSRVAKRNEPVEEEVLEQQRYLVKEAEAGRGVLLPTGGWKRNSRRLWVLLDEDWAEHYRDVRLSNWAAPRTHYAKLSTTSIHRYIVGAKRGEWTDHRNGNGMDDRRANLRIITPAQNVWNSRADRGCRGGSSFKGVRRWGADRWHAKIKVGGRERHLGTYDTQEAAALAYNDAAREAWGEYAWLNDVDEAHRLPRGIGNRTPDEIRLATLAAVVECRSVPAAAEMHGLEKNLVHTWVGQARKSCRCAPTPSDGTPITPDASREEVIARAIELRSPGKAGMEANRHRTTVRGWLRDAGVDTSGWPRGGTIQAETAQREGTWLPCNAALRGEPCESA